MRHCGQTQCISFFSRLFPRYLYRFGGDDGIRTHDPLLAGQVLSQLSYTPKGLFHWSLKIEQQSIHTKRMRQHSRLSSFAYLRNMIRP